jgi:hypothetical protein
VEKVVKKKVWEQAYAQISELERWLADDGQVLLKFWMHISKAEQKKRFRACLKDVMRRWKITGEYKRHHRQYDKWTAAVEEMLAKTDSPHAPWTVVEATDLRWARVKFFRTLVEKMEQALAKRQAAPAGVSRSAVAQPFMQALRADIKQHEDAALAAVKTKTKPAAAANPKAEVVHA